MKHTMIRVYGDETHCGYCGKRWDTNDLYPPPCTSPLRRSKGRSARIGIETNGYTGKGRYTFYDTASSWQFVAVSTSVSKACSNARKAFKDFKKTNYGQLEIVAGPTK